MEPLSVTFAEDAEDPTITFDKFKVNLDVLMKFVFDPELQWPLAAGRLFAFSLYGPLNIEGQLCTGPKGNHRLATWELDQMCMQIEKEDMLQIYLHKGSTFPSLSSAEQEAIIAQADAHLKRAKGKAMLPRLTPEDVLGILEHLPRNSDDTISFHEAQIAIEEYRKERIKQYKLVYPSLTKKKDAEHSSTTNNTNTNITNTNNSTMTLSNTNSLTSTTSSSIHNKSLKSNQKLPRFVSEAVAPRTMFLAKTGASNSDIIETTNKYLHVHAYKISTLDTANSPSMTANVRLLREVVPLCPNPYVDKNTHKLVHPDWDTTSQLTKTHIGSLVKCVPSSTTCKRNTTAY